jgi:hypothetical protein
MYNRVGRLPGRKASAIRYAAVLRTQCLIRYKDCVGSSTLFPLVAQRGWQDRPLKCAASQWRPCAIWHSDASNSEPNMIAGDFACTHSTFQPHLTEPRPPATAWPRPVRDHLPHVNHPHPAPSTTRQDNRSAQLEAPTEGSLASCRQHAKHCRELLARAPPYALPPHPAHAASCAPEGDCERRSTRLYPVANCHRSIGRADDETEDPEGKVFRDPNPTPLTSSDLTSRHRKGQRKGRDRLVRRPAHPPYTPDHILLHELHAAAEEGPGYP